MKHLLSICFLALMTTVFQSCNGNKTSNEDENVEVVTIGDIDNDYDYVDNDVPCNDNYNSSTNWDQVLDEYESYVNQYISLVKKANNGDMSAMSEYTKMHEKAESFSSKLESANDEMTSAQLSRYMKITNKMAQASVDGSSSYRSTKIATSDWDFDDDDDDDF